MYSGSNESLNPSSVVFPCEALEYSRCPPTFIETEMAADIWSLDGLINMSVWEESAGFMEVNEFDMEKFFTLAGDIYHNIYFKLNEIQQVGINYINFFLFSSLGSN